MDRHGLEETIARNICIGCGACAVVSPSISMGLTDIGIYKADIRDASAEEIARGSRVCPFTDDSLNEDELGAPVQDDDFIKNEYLGYYYKIHAGRVADEAYLQGSSSGGLTSRMLLQLLRRGLVDHVISVGRTPNSSELFAYNTYGQHNLTSHRKSHYYATTLNDVLKLLRSSQDAFAVVGVPCYIRALRNIAREEPQLQKRIAFYVGLVCGHMKTQAYAEALAWQVGVPPWQLETVDFRIKAPDRPASDYNFGAKDRRSPAMRVKRSNDLLGANWGHNLFQPEACNFCDDVVGETADISFGDAWLPRFASDPRGTNVVISRNRVLSGVLADGVALGEIELVAISAQEAAQSQAGGFRHRREGLALRLADDLEAGLSVPRKRVRPSHTVVSRRRAKLLRQRRRLAGLSHELFLQAKTTRDLKKFITPIAREIRRYNRLSRPIHRRALSAVKRLVIQ